MSQSKLNNIWIFFYPSYITINTLGILGHDVRWPIPYLLDMWNLLSLKGLYFFTNTCDDVWYKHLSAAHTYHCIYNHFLGTLKACIPYTNVPSKVHGLLKSLGFNFQWAQREVQFLAQSRCYQSAMVLDDGPYTRSLLGLKSHAIHIDLIPWSSRVSPLLTILHYMFWGLMVGCLKLLKQHPSLVQNHDSRLSGLPLSNHISVKPNAPCNSDNRFQYLITHMLNELEVP